MFQTTSIGDDEVECGIMQARIHIHIFIYILDDDAILIFRPRNIFINTTVLLFW